MGLQRTGIQGGVEAFLLHLATGRTRSHSFFSASDAGTKRRRLRFQGWAFLLSLSYSHSRKKIAMPLLSPPTLVGGLRGSVSLVGGQRGVPDANLLSGTTTITKDTWNFCAPSRVKVLRNPAGIFCQIVFGNHYNYERHMELSR